MCLMFKNEITWTIAPDAIYTYAYLFWHINKWIKYTEDIWIIDKIVNI